MYNSSGIPIVLIIITVGLGLKLYPTPLHQWTPDEANYGILLSCRLVLSCIISYVIRLYLINLISI
jgi:hypothetical protein